jgi:DNA repair protein RadC
VQLQAAREICRRSDFITLQKETQLLNSEQTCAFLKRQLRDKKNEVFSALFLDSQHRLLAYEALFMGTINATTVHVRPIIERTLKLNAAALIIAHNHPSGLSDASHHDFAVTERIQQALDLVDARLLDHFVVGDNEIYSIMSTMKWSCN